MQKFKNGFRSTIICLFLFCTSQVEAFEVKHAGALKNFMRKGDISAKFDLTDLKNKKGLYALGALENLGGEIQIFDSAPYNTFSSRKGQLSFDHSFQRKASLLVYTEVSAWDELEIPASISTRKQLEKFVENSALKNGIDTEKPFPFLIAGKAASISWHVVNWDKNDDHHTHRKHIESGPNGTLESVNALILGFYSSKHKAIFTHHSTNMHMHFKTVDNKVAGHIDQIILGKKMYLKLPRNGSR